MMKPLALVTAALMLPAPAAMAAQSCAGEQIRVLEEGKETFGPLSWPVCQPLPDRPELILASFYVWTDGGLVGSRSYQWHTAVLDSNSNQVLARYVDDIEEGTNIKVRPDSISVDTTGYALSGQVQAVGVRLNIGRKAQCAREFRSQFLTLFVYHNHILTPVLEKLPMAYSRVQFGEDCGYDPDYNKEAGKSRLQPLATSHYGFADLNLRTDTHYFYMPDYREATRERVHNMHIRYDGHRYRFDSDKVPGPDWIEK